MKTIPINVSKKILADVSSGIYRTPANALKELVSNSFDASANNVYISTNPPYFDVFTCEDDGEGMTAEEFKKILNRIGSSRKRAVSSKYKNGRPIIGKIGIGLLAIAQICNKFTVISKIKDSENYFQATIDLRQFDEIEKEASSLEDKGKINLGECELEEELIDEIDPKRQYTKIIMEDIKEGFKKRLQEEEEKKIKYGIEDKAKKSNAILNLVQSVSNCKSFIELSQYDQLIWELCLNCPIEYLEEEPLPSDESVKKHIKRLKNYKFKVFVDGFELRKPIQLPTDKELNKSDIDYKVYPPISFKKTAGSSELSFSGYIFHQRTRILPAELRGILIRIKDVAIGSYDKTFLHYPKAEGPMINQISGEIFVNNGLEEALNIDRNSFNETHSHFLALQEFIWDFLGGDDGVFKDVRARSKKRRDIFHEQMSEEELLDTIELIEETFDLKIKIKRNKDKNRIPYNFDSNSNTIIFYNNSFWSKHNKKRLKQEKIILTIVATKKVSNSVDSFEKNLLRLLSEW